MWDEIGEHLPNFESAVLTGIDAEGYPYSVRCRPRIDPVERVLRVDLAAGVPIGSGPASLLSHRHDENLWNQYSFLVRGDLSQEGGGWIFCPRRFVAGAGIGGYVGLVRFVVAARRTARRYLEKRGLARPRIPWDEINAIKAQARTGEQPTRK
jgi:hypothetical protein